MSFVVVMQRLGIIASALAPRRLADTIAAIIGFSFYLASAGKRSYIMDNLDHILDDGSNRDVIKRKARMTFVNFAIGMTDFFRLSYISSEDFDVDCEGIEHIDRALMLNRGCILISLHLGNWDYGGAYLAARGIPILALVQETDPSMYALYTRHREHTGMKTIPVSKAPYAFIEAMRKNKVLAILADRNVYGPGKPVRFFDGFRRIPLGLSEMIIRHNIPAVLSYVVMQNQGARYRLVIEPLPYDDLDSNALDGKMVGEFERIIKIYPDQWFVFHPEWTETERIHDKERTFAQGKN